MNTTGRSTSARTLLAEVIRAREKETPITLSAPRRTAAASDKARAFNMHRRAGAAKYNIARTLHKIINESRDLQPLRMESSSFSDLALCGLYTVADVAQLPLFMSAVTARRDTRAEKNF